ncbi:MAG: glycosyltransferase family 39 protein [Kiritimatiellae bacterium]|nr:glycosyltransferase family 39 protein [Kiritimatiellia bacterium]
MTRTHWLPLALILGWALALRIGIGLFLGFNAPPDRAACGADTVEFEQMAWSLAQGKGLTLTPGGPPTAFRAPGYPLLLGGLYALFGRAYFANRLALSLLGTGTVFLVFLLALQLDLAKGAALLAAFMAASLPLQFYWCGHFMSDPLAIFLNVACSLLLVLALRSPPVRRQLLFAALAGLACGLGALVRPAALLVPVLVGLLLSVSRHFRTVGTAALFGTFVIAAGLAIAPWTVRNLLVLDRFCLVASNGGSTFWGANNRIVADPSSEYWGYWISTGFDAEVKKRDVLSLPNEIDRDRREWALGRQFVRENPGRLPLLVAGKLYRLLNPFPKSPNRVYVAVVAASQIGLLPLALAGLVLALRNRDRYGRFVPVYAQLLALLATVVIFYGHERFRAGYEPFLAVLAALAVSHFWKRPFSTPTPRVPLPRATKTGELAGGCRGAARGGNGPQRI